MSNTTPDNIVRNTSRTLMLAVALLAGNGCKHQAPEALADTEVPASATACTPIARQGESSARIVSELTAMADLIQEVCHTANFSGWIAPGSITKETQQKGGKICTTATVGPNGIDCGE